MGLLLQGGLINTGQKDNVLTLMIDSCAGLESKWFCWIRNALTYWHYYGSYCRLEPNLANKTCSRGGVRTWVVSLFSVQCHTVYRIQSGLFKTRSVGAAITAVTGAQGKIQGFLAGRDVFFLHLSELTRAWIQLRRNARLGNVLHQVCALQSC